MFSISVEICLFEGGGGAKKKKKMMMMMMMMMMMILWFLFLTTARYSETQHNFDQPHVCWETF